jgi:DNA invertase Pin-like site-specific DNA recombinase
MSRHSSEPSPIAYSYIRFSSSEQAKGDSLRRQTAKTEAWCQRSGIALDASLSLRDAGVSAFRGKQRDDKFALGQFFKLAQRGRIPLGSYLIIENLDRLSREDERTALRLWMDILDAGVNIVQLVPETVFRHEKSDMVDVMRAIIELSRGHSESVVKSERLTEVWSQRKQRAREDGATLTLALPGWILDKDGKRIVPAEHKAAIKRIFQLAAQGYGHTRIIRQLDKEGFQPFGCSHRKQQEKPPRWTKTYIFDLLRDRRLLGEFQPRKKATGEPDGDLIADYFPRVLSDAEFYAGQQGRDSRKCVKRDAKPVELQAIDELHQQGEPVAGIARRLGMSRPAVYRALIKLGHRKQAKEAPERTVYPLAGMVQTAPEQERFALATWQSGGQHLKVLVSETKKQSFSYFVLEQAILTALTEINPREILEGVNGHDEVTALQTEMDSIEGEIAQMNAFMDQSGFSATIGQRVKAAETRLAAIAPQLEAAKQKASNPLSASWGEAQALAKIAAEARERNDADTLLRLRAALRRIVTSMQLLLVPRGRDKLAFAQLWFTGGGRHRDYLILHRPAWANAQARGAGGVWCVSIASEQGAFLDLRQADHVEVMTAALERLDLSDLGDLEAGIALSTDALLRLVCGSEDMRVKLLAARMLGYEVEPGDVPRAEKAYGKKRRRRS